MLGSRASTYAQICRQVRRSGQLKHMCLGALLLQNCGSSKLRSSNCRFKMPNQTVSIETTSMNPVGGSNSLSEKPARPHDRTGRCFTAPPLTQKKYHSTSSLSNKPEINKDLGERRGGISRARVVMRSTLLSICICNRSTTLPNWKARCIPGADPAAAAATQRFRYGQSGSCLGLNDE